MVLRIVTPVHVAGGGGGVCVIIGCVCVGGRGGMCRCKRACILKV